MVSKLTMGLSLEIIKKNSYILYLLILQYFECTQRGYKSDEIQNKLTTQFCRMKSRVRNCGTFFQTNKNYYSKTLIKNQNKLKAIIIIIKYKHERNIDNCTQFHLF